MRMPKAQALAGAPANVSGGAIAVVVMGNALSLLGRRSDDYGRKSGALRPTAADREIGKNRSKSRNLGSGRNAGQAIRALRRGAAKSRKARNLIGKKRPAA